MDTNVLLGILVAVCYAGFGMISVNRAIDQAHEPVTKAVKFFIFTMWPATIGEKINK